MAKHAKPSGQEASENDELLNLRVVFENDKGRIRLLSDQNRLAGYIEIAPGTPEGTPKKEEVLQFIKEHNVNSTGSATERIVHALESLDADGSTPPFLVAEGKAPVNGTDGSFKWLVQRPDVPNVPTKSSARVDYKERNVLVNVRMGQKILSIIPPTEGTAGNDIFGTVILSRNGRPVDIKRGKNTDVGDGGDSLVATVSGYLQVSNNTVSVEPVLFVNGNVDLSVGNIDFIGPVKVQGDILDGFRVVAAEQIEVSGTVEGAVLQSGGSIFVKGGVTGKGRGRIICKGDLEARYLNEVYVEAAGNVKVQSSIINCTVKSHGRVDVVSGGIRGANVVAANSLHSPEIGSDMGVRTMIVVGVDYDTKDKLVNVEREISVVKRTVSRIESALGPLLSNGEIVALLPPEKAEVARKLIAQLSLLLKRGDELATKRGRMLADMQIESDACIEIDKKLYAGVVMQIGTCRRTFEMEIQGPLKLKPDPEKNSLKVTR